MTERPSIILINCDDLGYGDLGCYGSEFNRSPALDRMAEEGVRFTDFYMASPICSPSRGAMMTGCYPRRIGFDDFDGEGVLFPGQAVGMSDGEVTVAGLLKGRGYATKIIGKWHCGDQPEFLPTRHGFDSYYGLPYSNDMGIQAKMPRENPPPLPLLRDEQVIEEQPDQATLTARYTEEAVRFMRENRDGPFFLYFAHMHVHLPHYVPEHLMKKSLNGAYGAAVAYIDWSTAVLLDELKQLGIDERTLIVFTSDNGSNRRFGGSNLPLRGRKGTTWEGGQRVACIARWAGTIPGGRTCSEVVTSMDFLPTFCALAGAKVPDDRIIDGRDVWPLMKGEEGAASPHGAFFYYMRGRLEAVRCGRWKLHCAKGQREIRELYDLESDIQESVDLVDRHPEVVAELGKKLEECRRDIGDRRTGVEGENCRPIGRVPEGRTLTTYDPDHPYVIAEYDLPHFG
ncbi:MAG: sulfatase family protein [Planctomycetota bacterium]